MQSVGHADLVQAPDGSWAAVYLGVRPRGSTPGYHVLGRETFLAGVSWVDGWPVFDAGRFDFEQTSTAFTEDFAGKHLASRWVVPDGDATSFARFDSRPGVLLSERHSAAHLLCTRIRDLLWEAEASFEREGELGIRIDDRHWARVQFDGVELSVVAQIGATEQVLAARVPGRGPLVLGIAAVAPSGGQIPFGHAGPDELVFTAKVGGSTLELARLDGRYLSTEVASGFTGRMLSLSSPGGESRLLRVTYVPNADFD